MKNILLILFTFFFNPVHGQTGLTFYSSDFSTQDSLEIKLRDVRSSNYTFHFRVILSGQIVEIFSQDNLVFHGLIINSIKEYNEVKHNEDQRTKATKLYTNEVIIDSLLATNIAYQIIKSGQLSIPTDTLINSWKRRYLHCGNLNFEIYADGKYIKQIFHCPWSQPDTAEFKNIILSNYNLLYQQLGLDSLYQEFWSQLPKGKTYSRNGYEMSYIFTDKQQVAWNKDKPRRDFLESIKDTVDNYLNSELRQQQIKLDGISCFQDYYLIFKKDGKLWKLQVSDYDKPTLKNNFLSFYLEDKMEVWKCKKLLKELFRKIDLHAFNPKYNVYRIVSFDSDGKVNLRDDTIY